MILPVNTYIATAEGISHAGATPIFVDINDKTYNIDISIIEEAINRKTKAINPVHLFGQSADMDEIMDIAKKHGLKVISDTAQSPGALPGSLQNYLFYLSQNLKHQPSLLLYQL